MSQNSIINLNNGDNAAQSSSQNLTSGQFGQQSKNNRMINCIECGKKRRCGEKLMCSTCLTRISRRKRKLDVTKHRKCKICGQIKWIEGNNLCKACYNRMLTQKNQADVTKHRKCVNCGKVKFHKAKNMCKVCYWQYQRFGKQRKIKVNQIVDSNSPSHSNSIETLKIRPRQGFSRRVLENEDEEDSSDEN